MSAYHQVVQELRSNPAQWRAFESARHCVTLAGPGSGKTKVLTAKLARVLRDDVRAPRAVACLTYNNECVRELGRRLGSLGVGQSPGMFVGTLHAFCLRYVLGPLGPVVGLDVPHPLLVASERVQAVALKKAMAAVGVNAQGFRTELDRFRRTAIDRREGQDGWEVGDRGLTDVCVEYERLLREQGRVDFDDIVLLSLRAIEDSETARRSIRARFPVLFVDEYQDLGAPLHRMVMALCFRAGVRLFAVGDPDQSIYGFTGARPGLLRALAERSDVERVDLRSNYRSGRTIVAASEYALGEKRGYAAVRSDDGRVEFTRCAGGLDAQVEWLAETLIPGFLTVGDRRGDIAVLYPTQQEGDAVETGLAARGVPFARLDRGVGYRRTQLVRLVEDFATWCCGTTHEGAPSLGALFSTWRVLLRSANQADERRARRSLVRFLFSHRDPDAKCHEWLKALDEEVFASSLRDKLPSDDDDIAAFDELRHASLAGGRLADLELRAFAGKSGSPDHITLMNLHTAKGTEFNAVVLVGMDAGRLPIYRASSQAEQAEQRRLFFVGVSRARREVHLLYSGFTQDRYGRRRDDGPSPFLVDLRNALKAR